MEILVGTKSDPVCIIYSFSFKPNVSTLKPWFFVDVGFQMNP